MLQTHISLLFFAGDRVYKVKKPVRFDFLDYGTLERRRFFCEEEVRLNRRLAADTYRGVVPIVRDGAGALRVGGAGEPVEYAVEMRRLPADRMLDALLARGEVDNDLVRRIVDVLVRFHAAAPTGPGVDEHGTPAAVRRNVTDNLRDSRPHLPEALHARVEHDLLGFLDAHGPLLERRVAEGRIRDGHGDLHAGNICLAPEGIVVYDCIEFEPRFRCGDVAEEIAFLAMDLDLRGFRGFADFLVRAYARRTDDGELPRLVPFYKTSRAVIRGLVGSLRAQDEDLDADQREAARREGLSYFHLALAYGLPPALLLTCGLPATGKTTVARALAAPFEAVLLRSDLVRKRLAGIPPTQHWQGAYDEGPYAPERTRETYGALLDQAGAQLEAGRTVVVDATFRLREWRDRFRAAARDRGAPCVVLHLDLPEEAVRARMAARAEDRTEVSDATLAVYHAAKEGFERPDGEACVHARGDRPAIDVVTAVLEHLAKEL